MPASRSGHRGAATGQRDAGGSGSGRQPLCAWWVWLPCQHRHGVCVRWESAGLVDRPLAGILGVEIWRWLPPMVLIVAAARGGRQVPRSPARWRPTAQGHHRPEGGRHDRCEAGSCSPARRSGRGWARRLPPARPAAPYAVGCDARRGGTGHAGRRRRPRPLCRDNPGGDHRGASRRGLALARSDGGRSRRPVQLRAGSIDGARLLMERKMLLGIKHGAESHARARAPVATSGGENIR